MSASVSDRHGSAHDPMCDDHHEGDCPWCNFAARVREDERPDPESAEADAYDHGYAAALRDAVETVKAMGEPSKPGVRMFRADAVAAIEALGGER